MMNGEEVMAKVVVCSECNTKNEYLAGIFVKCYFCQCINFVGYPYFGKTFQCIKVLCPSCISYTIVPKDSLICRCSVCGLLQYTELEFQDLIEEKTKEGEESAKEEQRDQVKKEEKANEKLAGLLSKSKCIDENPQFNTLEFSNKPNKPTNVFTAEKIKTLDNKKLVLKELKEKWREKKKKYIYDLDDILEEVSDESPKSTLTN